MKNVQKLAVVALCFGLTIGCEKGEENNLIDKPKEINLNSSRELKSAVVLTASNFDSFMEPVLSNLAVNHDFVEDYIAAYEDGVLTLQQHEQMLSLLNIDDGVDVSQLDQINQANGVYSSMDSRSVASDFPETPYLNVYPMGASKKYCDKLVKIRNAMIGECNMHMAVVAEYCKGAVMIAYYYKSRNC